MCPPISLPLLNARFLAATHEVFSPQARHDSVAQLVSLVATDGTCESNNWYNLPCRVRRPRRTILPNGTNFIAGAAIGRHSPIPSQTKMQRQEKQFFLPLLCPVKRYLLYHLWFAVYRNE